MQERTGFLEESYEMTAAIVESPSPERAQVRLYKKKSQIPEGLRTAGNWAISSRRVRDGACPAGMRMNCYGLEMRRGITLPLFREEDTELLHSTVAHVAGETECIKYSRIYSIRL